MCKQYSHHYMWLGVRVCIRCVCVCVSQYGHFISCCTLNLRLLFYAAWTNDKTKWYLIDTHLIYIRIYIFLFHLNEKSQVRNLYYIWAMVYALPIAMNQWYRLVENSTREKQQNEYFESSHGHHHHQRPSNVIYVRFHSHLDYQSIYTCIVQMWTWTKFYHFSSTIQ